MAFLFKSKKHQERALGGRDGHSGSQSSIQSNSARNADKNALQHRATPTGSLNSLENESTTGSPDQPPSRRGGSVDQASQSSDLPVSPYLFIRINSHELLR